MEELRRREGGEEVDELAHEGRARTDSMLESESKSRADFGSRRSNSSSSGAEEVLRKQRARSHSKIPRGEGELNRPRRTGRAQSVRRPCIDGVAPKDVKRTVQQMSEAEMIMELVGGQGNGQFQEFDYV